MRDVLIICPTRHRPEQAQRLIASVASTATARTDLVFAIDDDDDSYGGKLHYAGFTDVVCGPRQTCIQWTNQIALERMERYRVLASLGDDHIPLTTGWDTALLGAIADMGGTGISYGDDLFQHEKLPTAPAVSSDIVAALGWMMYPKLWHFYADDIWKDIAARAGCLRYVPNVVIQHLHWSSGIAEHDMTYQDADDAWPHDQVAYENWVQNEMAADVEKVRALRTAWTGGA
jgi:hypothetical protein